jgi:hypothetical protein
MFALASTLAPVMFGAILWLYVSVGFNHDRLDEQPRKHRLVNTEWSVLAVAIGVSMVLWKLNLGRVPMGMRSNFHAQQTFGWVVGLLVLRHLLLAAVIALASIGAALRRHPPPGSETAANQRSRVHFASAFTAGAFALCIIPV